MRSFDETQEKSMKDRILPPLTVLRLKKLWPYARKQGREIGQIYRVGYYCRGCGTETVWLVDVDGNYGWTADKPWIEEHFEIIDISKERSIYGKGKPNIGSYGQPVTSEKHRSVKHNRGL